MTRDRLEQAAPWAAGLLLAIPVVAFRYPPMGDLAMHEALVAIMHRRNDPTWAPPGLYELHVPQANQLFHILAYALSFVVRTDTACKAVVAGTILLTPVFLARLLRRIHARAWASLLALPVACGWMFRWGLVANLVGFALLLFCLPLLERLARLPSPRAIARCVGAVCLLFLAHESSALIFAVAVLYFALVRAGSARSFCLRAVPAAAALALSFAQWRVSRALAGASMQMVGSDYGAGPLDRITMLPGAMFGGIGPARLVLLTGAWVTALAFGACARRRALRTPGPIRNLLWVHRYLVLGAIFLLLFLVFPMSLGGTTLLAHRFLPGACAFLIVAFAPRRHRLAAAVLAAIVPVVLLGVEMRGFRQADQRCRDLDAVLPHLPDDVAVAQLDLTARPIGHVAPVAGLANRALAEHGGRMLFAMTDMPPNPVYVRPDLRWNEPLVRLVRAPFAFMPAYDATRFAYLLVRSETPRLRPLVERALAPEEERVASAGEWDLYRSTLVTVPVDSPDRPLPALPPETLAERLSRSPR